MQQTAKLGIDPVIISCDISNRASQKIIERNGGIKLGQIYDAEDDEHLYEYRIASIDEIGSNPDA